MTDEKKIKEIFGNSNHFDVPEGYFDNLTSQIMSQLPEQEARIVSIQHRHWWNRPLAIRKMAAAIAVLVVTGGAILAMQLGGSQQHQQQSAPAMAQSAHHNHPQTTSGNTDDADFEQMADYVMMDSQDFYASLVAEN